MTRDSITLPSGSVEATTSDGRISDGPVADVIDTEVVIEESDAPVEAEAIAEEADTEAEVADALVEGAEGEETVALGQLNPKKYQGGLKPLLA